MAEVNAGKRSLDEPGAAAPAKIARAAPPADPRVKHALMLMVQNGDAQFTAMAQACDTNCSDADLRTCCKQTPDTLHFTLAEPMLNGQEAANLHLSSSAPELPVHLRLAGLKPWARCLAASVGEATADAVRAQYGRVQGWPAGLATPAPRKTDDLHLSMYRGHGRGPALGRLVPGMKKAVAALPQPAAGTARCGSVQGMRIAIKVMGAGYETARTLIVIGAVDEPADGIAGEGDGDVGSPAAADVPFPAAEVLVLAADVPVPAAMSNEPKL
ncbi:hypothetical protein T492DRAFT_1061988 [Pavlovales sp. CCMP2436]|nr:hypothetical protein T492DRAFT_1061988 [Pavlovales sp. CCMP2436]